MIAKHYKTLKGIFNAFSLERLTFTDFLRGTLYSSKLHKTVKIEFTEDLKNQISLLLANAFCSKRTAPKYAKLIANYSGKSYGILGRLYVRYDKKHNAFCSDYCAGQEYTGEVRTIQNILRKGY